MADKWRTAAARQGTPFPRTRRGFVASHHTLVAIQRWTNYTEYRKVCKDKRQYVVSIHFDRRAGRLPKWILTFKGYADTTVGSSQNHSDPQIFQ